MVTDFIKKLNAVHKTQVRNTKVMAGRLAYDFVKMKAFEIS